MDRRPIATRNTAWAHALSLRLVAWNISPNAISFTGIVFALLAAAAMLSWHALPVAYQWCAPVLAAVCIQIRLLCNLMDGMVAVEGKKASPLGLLWNEVPDRIADTTILVTLGYAAGGEHGVWLGWCAALLAVFTAYVRLLGPLVGAPQFFMGPMSKSQRMALVTVTLLSCAGIAADVASCRLLLSFSLMVLNLLATVTVVRRLRWIARAKAEMT